MTLAKTKLAEVFNQRNESRTTVTLVPVNADPESSTVEVRIDRAPENIKEAVRLIEFLREVMERFELEAAKELAEEVLRERRRRQNQTTEEEEDAEDEDDTEVDIKYDRRGPYTTMTLAKTKLTQVFSQGIESHTTVYLFPVNAVLSSNVRLMDSEICTSMANQPISDYEELQVNEIENNVEAIEEVILGKEFMDVESAYKFYKNYGGKHGFNVRIRNSRKNSENFVTWKNGNFQVVSFQKSHNYALISTPTKHLLKVNRSISEAQKAHADDAEHSGFSIKATVELMSREVGGPENLGFSQKDYMNYIHRKRMSKMEKGDAGAILQTNEYGRPFAPFVGVNHHKQTTLFGAALLYDETTESFKWLFETFLSAMSGKQPVTILTDQSVAMARAIKDVFPQATHRLCVWHLYQNAAKNLSHVFHGSSEFFDDFSNFMYDYEFEHEWLLVWNDMLEKYSLKENKWLTNLFELREKWVIVYERHTFTADMKSTQRSECMNNVLKKYLKPEHNLLRFFEHYERVLADQRYQELIAEYKMIQTTPVLAVSAHMLQHGADVYTPEVFLLFQKEFVRIHNYSTYKVGKSGMTSEYIVSYSSEHNEHLVKYEASTQNVNCSCKKFTFVGILCAHALKVFDKKNVKKIPPQYILK
ncbi:protein FAR1-RELATED SEQUENCE 5-like [Rosa rugosa]|uniref:protein FAR1-RELATED SEQUENCE 5-like n=1 Tax=Rosa rugosa TaxID=74645 RepID=UPI002B400762|nr:protein FAR1-RELATED SEQUENCE 5-like [Rosa rugosa]